MHYNESIVPRLSRNPLGLRNSNNLSFVTSKKSSTTLNQSFHLESQSKLQTSKSRKSMDSLFSSGMFKKKRTNSSTQNLPKNNHSVTETK